MNQYRAFKGKLAHAPQHTPSPPDPKPQTTLPYNPQRLQDYSFDKDLCIFWPMFDILNFGVYKQNSIWSPGRVEKAS